MAPESGFELFEKRVTRRGFLKGTIGLAAAAAVAGGAAGLLAGCTKKAVTTTATKTETATVTATPDFTVTSSTDFNHSHKITVLGADVEKPPAADKTITSDGPTHTHTVTMTPANYQAVKSGQQIVLTSSSAGTTPHTHTFTIKKPV